MPPRLPSATRSLAASDLSSPTPCRAPCLASLSSSSSSSSSSSIVLASSAAASSHNAPSRRTFSTSPRLERTSGNRRKMFAFFQGSVGQRLAEPANSPTYVRGSSDQPFPDNPHFRSMPVLSDSSRNLIYEKVVKQGMPLKAVSAELGVDTRRVAAVVRMKTIEDQWKSEGKRLATPYAKAVMRMLPQTFFNDGVAGEQHHEPINDIHVHKYTMQQLFVPVSESRHFTRDDAAKAFHETMLSVDKRSRQPQLIEMERAVAAPGATHDKAVEAFLEATHKEEEEVAARILGAREREEKQTTRVKSERYEFRFKEVSVQDAGRDGRSRKATGWRYGAPLEDRKKGTIKIPTSVP